MRHTTHREHNQLIHTMMEFFDDEKPQVGIFWYDYQHNTLFGVMKDDAERYIKDEGAGTLTKLHKSYWSKHHFRAVSKNDTSSIFYVEINYTLIPFSLLITLMVMLLIINEITLDVFAQIVIHS